MKVAVVVGNRKTASRMLAAATLAARAVAGFEPETVIDLASMAHALVRQEDEAVSDAIPAIRSSRAVVVASPTFKASFSGLLKLVLDQFPHAGLAGVVDFPVMLGATWQHALAPELCVKPALVELGASCPVRGLNVLDSDYLAPPGLESWVVEARRDLFCDEFQQIGRRSSE